MYVTSLTNINMGRDGENDSFIVLITINLIDLIDLIFYEHYYY